ncbi:hypothetical protein [Streptomyces sp. RerS4]|uniref:TRADD-N-associated membrane domain-containing protein n=1 Tax=Streptomyces sp. RerS4 TaxID=2942449 RepID=UPI00201CAA9E|nr:hypothetical protein [Streptomyces sp. RerS4]UQX00994.1 hypothetical protein M4D82_10965 [Streptomyces sp. RerS4]
MPSWGVVGMVAIGEWVVGVGAGVAAAGLVGAEWLRGVRFERRRDEERARLLEGVGVAAPGAAPADPRFLDAGRHGADAEPVDRRDDFTPILVEYYAYGLAQARSSFATSQRFAGAGAAILLFGVALAVWKAESAGDMYVGVVTSSVGLVVTLVGQLFHRRADVALRHMAAQTAALREDRRAAENTQQAIGLLEEITDPLLRGRLQAGLILKLSGAELPPAAP